MKIPELRKIAELASPEDYMHRQYYRDSLYIETFNPDKVVKLLEAHEVMREAIQFALNYGREHYIEGDKGYQFVIFFEEALQKVDEILNGDE